MVAAAADVQITATTATAAATRDAAEPTSTATLTNGNSSNSSSNSVQFAATTAASASDSQANNNNNSSSNTACNLVDKRNNSNNNNNNNNNMSDANAADAAKSTATTPTTPAAAAGTAAAATGTAAASAAAAAATKSAVSQRNVDIKIEKSSNMEAATQQLTKKVLKLDLGGKNLDEYSLKSPKSPIAARLPHQTSLTSSVDVEDRKTLREALYQGIFHRHRRTIFAVGSFLRMLRSRNSQYNTIRSSSEGEDIDETIEDFILLVGTLVAFIAFILWCCFPIQPKEPGQHRQFTCKIIKTHIKAFDAATNTEENPAAAPAAAPTSTPVNANVKPNPPSSSFSFSNVGGVGTNLINGTSIWSRNTLYNGGSGSISGSSSSSSGSYSKNGTVAMHNYYVKNGHHCCT